MDISLLEKRAKHAAYMRAWCAKNRAKVMANQKRWRLADPEWNAKNKAYRVRAKHIVQANKKRYRERNREHLKHLKHESYLRCKARVLATCKVWHQNNLEKTRGYKKKWADRNPDHKRVYYQANKEQLKRKIRAYVRRNPHKKKEWEHRRRAAKRQLPIKDCSGKIALLRLQRFCRWCCQPMTQQTLTIDHIIPLVRGGAHIPDNLAAACSTCNPSKADRLVLNWLPTLKEAA